MCKSMTSTSTTWLHDVFFSPLSTSFFKGEEDIMILTSFFWCQHFSRIVVWLKKKNIKFFVLILEMIFFWHDFWHERKLPSFVSSSWKTCFCSERRNLRLWTRDCLFLLRCVILLFFLIGLWTSFVGAFRSCMCREASWWFGRFQFEENWIRKQSE